MHPIREEIRAAELFEPLSHYTDGVRCGDFLFLAGQASLDKEGKLVGKDDIVTQCRTTFNNLKAVLKRAGMEFTDIVSVTIYMMDINQRNLINPVRQEYFGQHRPVSTMIGVAELAIPGMLIEVQATAYKPGSTDQLKAAAR